MQILFACIGAVVALCIATSNHLDQSYGGGLLVLSILGGWWFGVWLDFRRLVTSDVSLKATKPDKNGPTPNFGQVSEYLYRGAQPNRAQYRRLKEFGIETIINLRELDNEDRWYLEGLGFNYIHLPTPDIGVNVTEQAIAFLRIVYNRNAKKIPVPIFVHCQRGADRTGMFVACFRCIIQAWGLEDAAQEMENFGFNQVVFVSAFDSLMQVIQSGTLKFNDIAADIKTQPKLEKL